LRGLRGLEVEVEVKVEVKVEVEVEVKVEVEGPEFQMVSRFILVNLAFHEYARDQTIFLLYPYPPVILQEGTRAYRLPF